MLGAQQVVTRKGDDGSHADMLSILDLYTTQGQRDAAQRRSLSGGARRGFPDQGPGRPLATRQRPVCCVCEAPPGSPHFR